MPCNCDYLNPSESEHNSRTAAQLIVYVMGCLELKVPAWIRSTAKEYYGNVSKLDELVVTLCDYCSNMTDKQEDQIIYNGRNKTARELADWWEEHQKADKKRRRSKKK